MPLTKLCAVVITLTALPLAITAHAAKREVILKIKHTVDCKAEAKSFHGVTGSVALPDRTVRFDLFEDATETEASLGLFEGKPQDLKVNFDNSTTCVLKKHEVTYEEPVLAEGNWSDMALKHSPFIVAREKQYKNRHTDIPLIIGYSTMKTSSHSSIKYTIVFSDEDSMSRSKDTDGQMARYGRRTDIEWIYEVMFDSETKATLALKLYHSDAAGGFGHATSDFKGDFVDGSNHPILFNIADNNVFRDKPYSASQKKSLVGHHLVPRHRIEGNKAREVIMFREPWTFAVSDREMAKEGKLSTPFQDYLYVRLNGTLKQGAFRGVMKFDAGGEFKSGAGSSSVDRLGEDLWGKESYTAIPIPPATLATVGTATGKFGLERAGFTAVDLALDELEFVRFYKNKEGKLVPGTVQIFFNCTLDGIKTTCDLVKP